MFAHLSILANLITGLLGVVAALVIFLMYKDRSKYIAYQSLQALIMQVIGWVLGGIVVGLFWAITGFLSAIVIGIVSYPLRSLLVLSRSVQLSMESFGAVKCNNGEDFQYWLIGDWVRGTYISES